jgi:hypothetical protein
MKKQIFILILSSFVAGSSWAEPVRSQTKNSMNEFLQHLTKLKKYLVSDEAFQNPKNTSEISSELKAFSEAVTKTKHDPVLIQENFKFSREILEDHIAETERVFRLGKKSYARWMLGSTLGLCMSCHTQMPTPGFSFDAFTNSKFFTSDFDQAEFLFAIKDFDKAATIYRRIVANFPTNNISSQQLEKCVRRPLIYRLRVRRDRQGAKNLINEFLNNKKLPEFVERDLKVWNEQLTKWEKRKLPNPASASSREIKQFAEKNLSLEANESSMDSLEPKFISNYIVSGILYEYLQKHPGSDATPDVLYWLAVVDREISHSFFYSLADMYLKECMLRFPQSPIAIRCYKEYESQMIFGYSGSGGTNLPGPVAQDLKNLKAYVESQGKTSLKNKAP